jgi:hypothetical protein
MAAIDIPTMRDFLGRSLSSVNSNKINGMLAEIDLRRYITSLGYGRRVSPGGWISRSHGPGIFGHTTCVYFPQIVEPGVDYAVGRILPEPESRLHAIAATFHQTGISAYYCVPEVQATNDATSVRWLATQLGVPDPQPYAPFPDLISGFRPRTRKQSYLRKVAKPVGLPDEHVPEEFSKESVRVAFQTPRFSETVDVDGFLWGEYLTYPLEVKEKTAATSGDLGPYFGLDIGPFAKLTHYAAKRGNLNSLFIVREITDTTTRALNQWWVIKFEVLAKYASWVFSAGGTNMRGGQSSVVRIPKQEFVVLDKPFLDAL